MNLKEGQTFGRYRTISLRGEGGMGAVYRAHDAKLKRDVAIKVLHSHYARLPDFRQRFLQEAQTAANLEHPGIVEIHDIGEEDDQLFIVMEFIDGSNLHELLAKLRSDGTWIALPEAVQLVVQIADALEYAHRRGVLHRDIKPANIMLKPEGADPKRCRPVITDMGLAKLVEGGLVTQTGMAMGTPAYMAPEQALGEPVGPATDIYALGVMLYELVVGQLPYPANTLSDAFRIHHRGEPPPAPRSLRGDLPEHIEHTILHSLERKPSDRFTTAGDLASTLLETPIDELARSVPPTAVAGVVSLQTQFQESLIDPRGASILDEFPHLTAVGGHHLDRIQVLAPDGKAFSFEINKRSVTVGRSSAADIVLEDEKASRLHLKVEFDGANYYVIDQNSTNGIYRGDTRLLGGVREQWGYEKPLRIGSHYLRLVPYGDASQINVGGTRIYTTNLDNSSDSGPFAVFIETDELAVAPGDAVELDCVILNIGDTVEHVIVSVEGVNPQWVQLPPTIQLMPHVHQAVKLPIQPPYTPQSRAGSYELTVHATSRDRPDKVTIASANLKVKPFEQFHSELRPQQIRSGISANVIVENQGNAQQMFTLSWQDRSEALRFEPANLKVEASPGDVETVSFRATPYRRRLIGGEQTHSISMQVRTATGDGQTHSGEVVTRGLIPFWIPPLLFLLLIGFFGWFWQTRNTWNAISGEETRVASAAMQAAQARNEAATLTVEAEESEVAIATEAAVAASSATAEWRAGDEDGDGLSNEEEEALGTRFDRRDTDNDGLDDGDELNNETDPLVSDTDDDGIKDGDEVLRSMNPLRKDSDLDGILDAVDDAPLATSTPTLRPPTPTWTPKPPTPTWTPEPPTPTWTPEPPTPTRLQGTIEYDIGVDHDHVGKGECITFHWNVRNAAEVYYIYVLNGQEIPVRTGSEPPGLVSPRVDSSRTCDTRNSFTMRWRMVGFDGSEEVYEIPITVE